MTHDCEAPARLFIDSVQYPIINDGVETQIRKDGPADFNRLTDVFIPAIWEGTDYISKLNPLLEDNEQTGYPYAFVEYKDPITEQYEVVHSGYLMSAGATGHGNLGLKVRIGDFANLLEKIPVGKTYPKELDTVVRDIIAKLQGQVNVGSGIEIRGVEDGMVEPGVTENPFADFANFLLNGELSKTFKRSKHTLIDVMDWITERADVFWYFDHDTSERQPILVIDKNPTDPTVYGRYAAEDTNVVSSQAAGQNNPPQIYDVYQNNALYEISPYNTLTVRGQTKSSIEREAPFNIPGVDAKHPVATAVHKPLKGRVGGTLEPPEKDVDAKTLEAAENTAKKKLKNLLDESGGGTIELEPAPRLRPYTEFIGQPVCGKQVAADVPAVNYEIEEVRHRFSATEYPRTELSVSYFVNNNEIEIKSSKMVET